MVAGNKISLFEQQTPQATAATSNQIVATLFGFELIGTADKVVITIQDKAGNLLKTVEIEQGLSRMFTIMNGMVPIRLAINNRQAIIVFR